MCTEDDKLSGSGHSFFVNGQLTILLGVKPVFPKCPYIYVYVFFAKQISR